MKRIAITHTALVVGAGLTLAGCSSGSASTGPAGSAVPTTSATSATGQGAGRGAGRVPGVNGLIAAVTGTTMQVQGNNQQTAVSWSATTTFSRSAPASAADVTPGSCVVVRASGAGPDGETGMATTPGAADGGVTAASVEITAPSAGGCASAAPSGVPAAAATTGPRTGRAGFGAAGTVASVQGASFTVQPSSPGGSATSGPVRPVTVLTTGSTSYTKAVPASASDVRVGECVTAVGPADETGSVTAASLTLRAAVNGGCGAAGGAGRTRPPGSSTTGTARG